MAFLEDIGKIFSAGSRYPVQLVGKEGVVINGYSTLLKLSQEEMVFCFGKDRFRVCGCALTLLQAEGGEAFVKGEIKGVFWNE